MPNTNLNIQHHVALKPYTTLDVGGAAQYFVVVTTHAALQQAIFAAKTYHWPIFILGGGSNIVVADQGFEGLCIYMQQHGMRWHAADADTQRVTVAAAEPWDAVVQACVARNLYGIECLSGIPGFAGSAPVQNIGAYGQELGHVLSAVHVLDCTDGSMHCIPAKLCGLGYRDSYFKHHWRQRYVITAIDLLLHKQAKACARYKELQDMVGMGPVALHVLRDAVLSLRRGKSMLWDTTDANHRSVGSFFTNPVLSLQQLHDLQKIAADVPYFVQQHVSNCYKLSAAWLIEKAGFSKGYLLGPAGISSKHALALINCGNATAADIMTLACNIYTSVLTQFGIALAVEPTLLGFDAQDYAMLQRKQHKQLDGT